MSSDAHASSTIERDLPCVDCGYDLRGLNADGACPECGAAIQRSLAGDRLSAANPVWLRRIVRGQRLLGAGLLAVAIGVFGSFFALGILAVLNVSVLHDDPTINDLLGWIIALFVQVTVFGGLIAAVIGAFLVTAPDPRQRERESPASARNAARLAAVSTIVLFAASTATGLIRSGGPWQMAHQVLMIAAFAALALTILGLLRVFESLAARTFDAALPGQVATRYRRLRWLLPAMIGGMLLMELGSGRGGSFGTILDAIVAFGSCAVVVFWIMLLLEVLRFVSLMVSLRRALRHCLENAANDVR